MPQRLYWIELRRSRCRIQTRKQAYKDRKAQRRGHQPRWHHPERLRPDFLALQVDVGRKVDHTADRPSESGAESATEQAHGPGLKEKDSFYVTVARAQRLHDSDLAPALQNRHDQRIHDPQ